MLGTLNSLLWLLTHVCLVVDVIEDEIGICFFYQQGCPVATPKMKEYNLHGAK